MSGSDISVMRLNRAIGVKHKCADTVQQTFSHTFRVGRWGSSYARQTISTRSGENRIRLPFTK
jgi:hypothetical protein